MRAIAESRFEQAAVGAEKITIRFKDGTTATLHNGLQRGIPLTFWFVLHHQDRGYVDFDIRDLWRQIKLDADYMASVWEADNMLGVRRLIELHTYLTSLESLGHEVLPLIDQIGYSACRPH